MEKLINGRMMTRDEAVMSNMPLVAKIAKNKASQLRFTSLEISDLVSAGSVGLMKAYDSYDSKQGAKFSHYAYIQIESEINFEITKNGYNSVYFPIWLKRLARKIAANKWAELSCEDLAERMNETIENVQFAKACLAAQRSYVSFEGERNLSDILGYTQESELIVRDFMSRLGKVDQEILTMKLRGEKHTVIAQHVGCTANNIKHRLNKIREKYFAYTNGHRVNVSV
ncbi:sigma-70 family RNA polymerase sigma factor [Bacillus sp. L381]|uniref:sigma-70 family RNA polymerase sigma factor n=1 Tax=Bacillus TaxID=1386 RepID=UPI001BAB197E|nr:MULTISPECIES: sigma-70 family RNA polymerase sigma factor [Bacillus]MCR9040911.1 sigma-70 family RNA polymerase sigma factor [Bacillus velezensis]QUN08002.1 sigma-70 family RNA polymerase sigma factor [Bacillus amyloliquefaciens]QYM81068.1 sigma-70 family RNA polymerase sigma factor [Bacillus sp. 7D3]QZY10217.1 sigma-70 family RNA polymerase sigma factor [Bacillus amyloliquefaciens]QZY11127.1 sigma-70 family RNA polymerase sigma factor [Bacillus amyloliquefaciens]